MTGSLAVANLRVAGPLAAWGLGLLYAGAVLWVFDLSTVLAIPSDDAFYYFQIARNIMAGEGCSFDGLAETNGFHPLWMLCVLPFYAPFVDLQPEFAVRLILALQGLLAAASLTLVGVVSRRLASGTVSRGALAICFLPNILLSFINGMETGLLILLLLALVECSYRWRVLEDPNQGRYAFLWGALLGLVTLARLDCVFLLPAFALVVGVRALRGRCSLRQCLRQFMLVAAGFSIPFLAFLAWNLASFGHLLPISGAVKSTLPGLRRNLLLLNTHHVVGAVMLCATAVAIWLWRFTVPREQLRALRAPLLVLLLAGLFHYLYEALFVAWGVYWWHFASYGPMLALALAPLANSLNRKAPKLEFALAAMLAVSGIFGLVVLLDEKREQHDAWYEAASWARENTAPGTVFALKDAGLFGYFSERPTINLDGKANGYEYLAALRQGSILGYLEQHQTSYIADINGERGVIHLWRPGRAPLRLTPDPAAEVYRSQPARFSSLRFGSASTSSFVIWRLHGIDEQ